MLTFKIEDKEFENRLLEFVKLKKKTIEDIAFESINIFIDLNGKNKLNYTKKDPLKHLHKIQHEYDETLCDDIALTHIKDSATHIHNLRRQKNC